MNKIGKKQCIIITGMHRSGTSALAGVFNNIGVYIGKDLIGAGKTNPKGHFENKKVIKFNEKVLIELGGSWHRVKNYSKDLNKSYDNIDSILDILKSEFNNNNLFLIKDPRLSLLLPLWEKALASFDTEIKYIISIRKPLEVAKSINKRNNFDIKHGLDLWLMYMFDSEFYTRKKNRFLIDFDSLINEKYKSVKSICLQLSILEELNFDSEIINSFLDVELKHYNNVKISHNGHMAYQVYDLILKINKDNEKEITQKIDVLRKQFKEML